jgi:hypothetical protein
VVGNDQRLCINVVGRKSCRLWGHQGSGGGAGWIRYIPCKECSSNCWAYGCVSKLVGQGNVCYNLDPDGFRDAFFLAQSNASCLIGKRDGGNETEVEVPEELKGKRDDALELES